MVGTKAHVIAIIVKKKTQTERKITLTREVSSREHFLYYTSELQFLNGTLTTHGGIKSYKDRENDGRPMGLRR